MLTPTTFELRLSDWTLYYTPEFLLGQFLKMATLPHGRMVNACLMMTSTQTELINSYYLLNIVLNPLFSMYIVYAYIKSADIYIYIHIYTSADIIDLTVSFLLLFN